MSETLEQIVRNLHVKLPMATQEDALEFARQLIAALGAQEPVAWLYTYDGRPYAAGLKPRVCWADPELHPLYAAPQLPREGCEDEGCPHYGTPHSHGTLPKGWQLVPKEPTKEMLWQLFHVKGTTSMRRYTAALAAAPKPEDRTAPDYPPRCQDGRHEPALPPDKLPRQ